MTRNLDSLDRLNKLADKNAFGVDDIDWSRPIQRDRLVWTRG